jgi:SAM-dependent methyltransferase
MSSTIGYKKNWYKEWFGEEYLTVYEHRDEQDAQRLVSLILSNIKIRQDSYILDIACGAGRHAVYFTEYTSRVYGIDLSRHLLDKARKSGMPPYFVQADMRYLPIRKPVDLVFSLFTSFGYFEDDETNKQVAIEMSRMLKKNGDIVIDYLNRDYVTRNLVEEGQRMAGDMHIFEKRWVSRNRVYKEIRLDLQGEDKIFYESVRLFSKHEMHEILSAAGIQITALYGEYDGSAYKRDSSRMIIFGKKE